MRPGSRFAVWSAAVGAGVWLLGLALAGVGATRELTLGVLLAWVVQAGLFWLLAERLFPGRLLLVYGVGMAGRFLLLGVAAFLVVPAARLQALPFLLSLVGVLTATTVLEPLLLAGEAGRAGSLRSDSVRGS